MRIILCYYTDSSFSQYPNPSPDLLNGLLQSALQERGYTFNHLLLSHQLLFNLVMHQVNPHSLLSGTVRCLFR